MKPLEIREVYAKRVIATNGNTLYVWDSSTDSVEAKRELREEIEKANPGKEVITLSGAFADYDTDRAFIFYVADCFSPPLYLVWGRSFEDAYESFITEFEDLMKIEGADLADYGDNFTVNDNGTPVDTESVQYINVQSLILTSTNPA